MSKTFLANYDSHELKTRLNSLIEVKSEDTLKNHFQQTMFFKNDRKVSGTIKKESFKIWFCDEIGGLTGMFYPIIEGTHKPNDDGLEIAFKSKPNIISRIFYVTMSAAMAYVVTFGIIIQEDNPIKYLFYRAIAGAVLFGLMMSLPTILYFKLTSDMKEYLIKELDLKKTK
ncbi:MAG: hypothetical protein ABI723_14220 [Bacteroidia bacterium]